MNWFFWKKQPSISELSKQLQPSFCELKKRTRIAVIDDDRNAIPVESLQTDGFAINAFPQIDVSLLSRLERGEFDIIILDIKGVVSPGIINNEGLGVLHYLKTKNPTQLIIACSSKKFDASQQKFFNLADDILDKPITFVDCKEKLEQIIMENMNLDSRWHALSQYLQTLKIDEKSKQKLEKNLIYSLQSRKPSIERVLRHMDKHAPSYNLIFTAFDLIFRIVKQ